MSQQQQQQLVEKIIRERIYDNLFWKEHCYLQDAESIIDVIVERVTYIGGPFGGTQMVTPFLCCLLKICQMQVAPLVLLEYIKQTHFKYLTILGLVYLRMVAPSAVAYVVLESFLKDRRRLRLRLSDGSYAVTFVDQVADRLLTEDRVFGLILPRLSKRQVLEQVDTIIPTDWISVYEQFAAVTDNCVRLGPRPLFGVQLDPLVVTVVEEKAKEKPKPLMVRGGGLKFKSRVSNQSVEEGKDHRIDSAEVVESLSIEETNKLRISLGLKPLS